MTDKAKVPITRRKWFWKLFAILNCALICGGIGGLYFGSEAIVITAMILSVNFSWHIHLMAEEYLE